MPATTTTLKIPYPLDSDRLEDFPTVAKQAAQVIDARDNDNSQDPVSSRF
nr:MAG TPA: hypothetical protein [Caudoviricetes sp.]